MKNFLRRSRITLLLILTECIFLCLGILFISRGAYYQTLGCLLWGAVTAYFLLVMPSSGMLPKRAFLSVGKEPLPRKLPYMILCVLLILVCILPMGAAPAYNGEFPQHRNQYELLARSMKAGHLYIDYDDVDPRLAEMENPYSPAARAESGVSYHSDHAYYKGHYYMYFGVVPVFLLFMPYLLLTGQDLTTYHATQIFTAFAILGIFLLFYQIAQKYFRNMYTVTLLSLCTAFATISVYFSVGTPALYCTATSSGVCMEVWSLYFFIRAIYIQTPETRGKRVASAMLGSLFGALAFGCRPTAALGNLLLIPFCVEYLRSETELSRQKKEKKYGLKLAGRVFLIAFPYLVIGSLLMLYNYLRFESVFEFGQAYQLTGADQSGYGNFLENFSTVRTVNGIVNNFIFYRPIVGEFPFAYYSSALVNFPILILAFLIFREDVQRKAKTAKMRLLMIFLLFTPFLITFMQIAWAPGDGTAERYRMDIYYLLVLVAFLVIGCMDEARSERRKRIFNTVICLLCLQVMLICPLFLLFPDDYNYTHWFPESLDMFRKIFMLH